MSEEAVSWTREAAAHLLRRAGFGGTPAEIDDLFARGLAGAVSRLVDYEAIDTTAYEAALNARGYNLTTNRGLQQWALDRMTFSPRPLEEKMTYFWNLHWTSGLAKVQGVTLMLNQNKTMRQYAVLRFDDLVIKISQDPAMLIWLDNWLSRVGRPNENYGRELMELFTIGVDSGYTQTDVTMVARALTGWTLVGVGPNQNNDATFFDNTSQHDNGVKTILGQTGSWNALDAINIILNWSGASGSKTGRFMTEKLWTFFTYANPPDAIVDQLTAVWSSSNRSIREVLRALFMMPEFYELHSRKKWVRSPVEYAVAAVRMLGGQSDFVAVFNSLTGMGQTFFNPADAKGPDWGLDWMNTGTLFARANFVNTLCTNRGSSGTRFDANALLSGHDASTADKVVDLLADRLNISDVPASTRVAWISYMNRDNAGNLVPWTNTPANVDKKVRGVVHLMLTCPAFHLA
jgi:uncharacterized protein (DUF1800 family)